MAWDPYGFNIKTIVRRLFKFANDIIITESNAVVKIILWFYGTSTQNIFPRLMYCLCSKYIRVQLPSSIRTQAWRCHLAPLPIAVSDNRLERRY